MFTPPITPSHLTTQLENVHFINQREASRKSSDPDAIAWYIGLSDNLFAKEQFTMARDRVAALVGGGWMNHGTYSDLGKFLAGHAEIEDRMNDDPTRFTSVAFFIDGTPRYFLLEAPRKPAEAVIRL